MRHCGLPLGEGQVSLLDFEHSFGVDVLVHTGEEAVGKNDNRGLPLLLWWHQRLKH